MFDFPNSPSVGQRVTGVGGIVYVWDGTKWTNSVGGVTVQSMGDVGRNLIHNPLFNFAQRGTGPFSTVGYTLDRWFLVFALDATGVQQVSFSDLQRAAIGDEAATKAMAVTVTGNAGAGSFSCINQYIEGVHRLAGKTVTVSFWAYATVASPRIGVAATQQFGTGGSPSADVLINGIQTPPLTNSPVRYSVTFTYPSIAGKTLGTNGNDYSRLALFFSCGATNNIFAGNIGVQSAVFVLWGVQLEIGSVATPLEKPDPRYDLANCRCFYRAEPLNFIITFNAWAAGATENRVLALPGMRAPPTVVLVGTSGNVNVSSVVVTAVSANAFQLTTTFAAAGGSQITVLGYTASADL